MNNEISFEELIKNSAYKIVDSEGGYHAASFKSELHHLNNMMSSKLRVEAIRLMDQKLEELK